MRLKNNYNIAKKCSGDICTILHEQSKDGTKDIDTRVIEITLPDGKKEYLATNLFDKSITQKMFSELYFYRWLLSNLSSLIKNQADDEIGITADLQVLHLLQVDWHRKAIMHHSYSILLRSVAHERECA